MSLMETRRAQIFPVLDAAQVETAKRFASGPARAFAAGEQLYEVGDRGVPAWLLLEGAIELVRHDGLARSGAINVLGPGQFTGEVSQLGGRGTLAAARAGPKGATALPFDAAHLRALLIGAAELGEIVMRALILRRMSLLEAGDTGSILVGPADHPDVVRLEGFLSRNAYPHTRLDALGEGEGHAIVERLGVPPEALPLMICPNGTVLRRPTNSEAANCLGILLPLDPDKLYDVAIVGAGPAGLATAVYAASEGLSVLALDQRATGGQAGASARIENYLGFPTGISGQALAGRAWNQAQKFGAEIAVPIEVVRLNCDSPWKTGDPLRLDLSDGSSVQAKTVVIASGARYRRPDIPNIEALEGAGVSYWASAVEAKLCEGEEVALMGGGNSAGQAVAFLAPKVKRLNLIVRGPGLEATMSRYLIERIAALPNVELHAHTEIVALEGDRSGGLTAATCRNRETGVEIRRPLRHLFLFIGADPNAGWLQGCVETDAKGFVTTGADPRLPLQTALAGVFAIGDVRAGSTKRVAAAVGEGAAVVAQIHAFLAQAVTGA
ncbi:FAD-dependent oxidoreductase [Phenylobacterium sp.]|uniref:FAD-dependent oxidoreductase n=1 Tax=Phenylobacterium sp. TaxID=1871053 RepID=UPI002C713EF4|nr:FAD-dependent oxidoreductase [Phenylobacterium sp.]HLZ76725.1 FAD-dependent oxidoreductase [Phenylobacterium sp.]